MAVIGALALPTIGLVATAMGDDAPHVPSIEHGFQLASGVCAGCHLVPGSGRTAAQDGIPTFETIANRPDQTKERIIQSLLQPHPPMPEAPLSMPDIIDVIAYLDTLRREDAGAPLLPPLGRAKPPADKEPS